MLHEERKTSKIIEELTIFFFNIGATDITSRIQCEGNKGIITFTSNYDTKYERKLNCIEEMLKEQKAEYLEDIFWELAGSGDPGESSQLLLIGMMVDKAEVIRESGHITIRLEKSL